MAEEHRRDATSLGRVAAILGLLLAVGWLVWRVTMSLDGVEPWLAAPAMAVEVLGLVGSALLVWALWHPAPPSRPAHAFPGRLRVLVRVEDHRREDVRATVVAALGLHPIRDVTVVDLRRRPEVERIAGEHGVGYLPVDADDGSGLVASSLLIPADAYLVLDAGDVPVRDAVALLAAHLDDDVAIVQGAVGTVVSDSAEHGADGRYELRFETVSLNPALAARGCGIFTGSGALVRRAALESVGPVGGSHLTAELSLTVRLLAAGWRIVAPAEPPVVAVAALQRPDEVAADRRRRSSAAVSVLVGPRQSVWVRGLRPSQRLGLAAWCVRPLSGMRRVLFVAVVLAALLSGQPPFHVALAPVLALWAPSLALLSLGVVALSNGTLRLGDRARWSLRTMAPSVAGLAGPDSWPGRGRRAGAIMQNGGLVALLVVLDAAVVLRALSDRWLDILPVASRGLLAVLLLMVLWLEAIALDELRLLARGRRRRRAVRRLADLPGSLDGVPATIADLTVLGAGVALASPSAVGDRVPLVVQVPDGPRTDEVRVTSVVRNVRQLEDGRWRLGVEFTEVSAAAAVALTEWCVVRPARAGLGEEPAMGPAPWIGRDDEGPGRSWIIQVTSLVAVVGVVAMMLPAAARADDEVSRMVEGVLVTDLAQPVPGGLVTAVCAQDPGFDQRWGTSDDQYRGPVSDRTDRAGRYRLPLAGEACWLQLAPPVGHRPLDQALAGAPVPIEGDDPLLTVLTATATATEAGQGTAAIDGVVRSDDGVNGVTVALVDEAGQVAASMVSRSRGRFSFGGLPAGTYSLRVSNLPSGLVPDPATPAAVGGDLGTVSVAEGQQLSEVTLVVGRPVLRTATPGEPALLPATAVEVPSESGAPVLLPIAVTTIALILGVSLLVQAERLRRARDRHPSSGLVAAGADWFD